MNTNINKRMRWHRSNSLAELTLLLDALVANHRRPIFDAAMTMRPADDFEASHFVGIYRNLLFQTLEECFDLTPTVEEFRRVDKACLTAQLDELGNARDLAQAQRALHSVIDRLAELIVQAQGES